MHCPQTSSNKITPSLPARKKSAGFTLIEIVIGIVVSAIALTFMSTLFFSSAGRSVEPMLQIRAVEFGHALMDEILSKSFDRRTPVGGVPACNPCTPATALGSDGGESRATFDDVDDYNDYCGGDDLYDSLGTNLSQNQDDPYYRYSMSVCVFYDNDYDGNDDAATVPNPHVGGPAAKLIIVDITPPSGAGLGGSPITITAYRSNF